MKQQILTYIQANPGCTSSGVNKAVRRDQSLADWVYTRREIDQLISDGLVEEREFRGITTFYAKEAA